MPEYVFPLPKGAAKNKPTETYHVRGASDLLADTGTPIYDMAAGKVTLAGWDDYGGNSVEVQADNGLVFYYAHMRDAPLVTSGQTIQPGTQLGVVGRTGNASSLPESQAHLHIGIGYGISDGIGPAGGAGVAFDAQAFLTNIENSNAYVNQDTTSQRPTSEPVYSGQNVTDWIREVALYYCINVNDAWAAADSEGGRSQWDKLGDNGQSHGPFQLFYGGGLGNQFTQETGIAPGDSRFGPESVRWALRWVKDNGWYTAGPDGPCTGNGFHGPCRAGFTRYQGIGDCSQSVFPVLLSGGTKVASINAATGVVSAIGSAVAGALGLADANLQAIGLDVILAAIAILAIAAGLIGIANQSGAVNIISKAAVMA